MSRWAWRSRCAAGRSLPEFRPSITRGVKSVFMHLNTGINPNKYPGSPMQPIRNRGHQCQVIKTINNYPLNSSPTAL